MGKAKITRFISKTARPGRTVKKMRIELRNAKQYKSGRPMKTMRPMRRGR